MTARRKTTAGKPLLSIEETGSSWERPARRSTGR